MRAIILLLLLLSSQTNAGILVIGDSLSAQATSWPTYLREKTGENVMVMAQNGRTIRGFSLPDDLHADSNVGTVFYFLGANDSLKPTISGKLEKRIRKHLRFLKDRGFRVIVILVPEFANLEAKVQKVNAILLKNAEGLKLETLNLMPVWDNSLTADTVHPLPELSRIIADYVGAAFPTQTSDQSGTPLP